MAKSHKQPPRKKKTNAEKKLAKLKNQRVFHSVTKVSKEEVKNFKWEELKPYHNECEGMFAIALPFIEVIKDESMIERIKSKGDYPDFLAMVNALKTHLGTYRTNLDAIAAKYEGRVVNDDNLLEEVGMAISVGEDYRQWLDSFRAVIIEGLSHELSTLISSVNVEEVPNV